MLLKYNVLFYYISGGKLYGCCADFEKKENDCIRKL